jgi:hypothetical protein
MVCRKKWLKDVFMGRISISLGSGTDFMAGTGYQNLFILSYQNILTSFCVPVFAALHFAVQHLKPLLLFSFLLAVYE